LLGTYEKTFSGEELSQWLSENVEGFGGDWERCVEAAAELYKMGHISRIGVGRGFEPHYDTYYTLKSTLSVPSILKSYLPITSDEPSHLRLRREAVAADETLRQGILTAEERRLELEERIERGLRIWERWERERLGVNKTGKLHRLSRAHLSVLQHYDQSISQLPKRLADLSSSTSLAIEAFNPDADLKALIEGNRTGPFRPQPHVYETAEIPDVNFGIDLRRWSGELGWKGMMNAPKRPRVPDVLTALLAALVTAYEQLPPDEQRRSWIYEVPLHETHALRNSINASRASLEEMGDIVDKFNVPVIAGVVKLYLLELNPPVLGWEGWEDARGVYPSS
jgi:hypothetical protein